MFHKEINLGSIKINESFCLKILRYYDTFMWNSYLYFPWYYKYIKTLNWFLTLPSSTIIQEYICSHSPSCTLFNHIRNKLSIPATEHANTLVFSAVISLDPTPRSLHSSLILDVGFCPWCWSDVFSFLPIKDSRAKVRYDTFTFLGNCNWRFNALEEN